MLLLSSLEARRGRYKHTVFWTNHRNQVHGKVTLSVDFLFYSRLSSRPLRARVRDRDNDKQERSYEQTNDNQTAVILETKWKATAINRQAKGCFASAVASALSGEPAPCKGERHQTAQRLWYSELYHFKAFALKWYASP